MFRGVAARVSGNKGFSDACPQPAHTASTRQRSAMSTMSMTAAVGGTESKPRTMGRSQSRERVDRRSMGRRTTEISFNSQFFVFRQVHPLQIPWHTVVHDQVTIAVKPIMKSGSTVVAYNSLQHTVLLPMILYAVALIKAPHDVRTSAFVSPFA